jgi:hypothetical protein
MRIGMMLRALDKKRGDRGLHEQPYSRTLTH